MRSGAIDTVPSGSEFEVCSQTFLSMVPGMNAHPIDSVF